MHKLRHFNIGVSYLVASKCEDNEYLSQFKLKSTGVEGKNKYEYTCCKD